MNFTHLHVHSHYSILDGMSKVPELVDKCLRTGMHAIALTDHGNMYGIKELLDYCQKVNDKRKEQADADGTQFEPFKPIVGCEAYCARRDRQDHDKGNVSGWHLILLAKNKQGYKNLCKLVSESYMDESFYGKPRIDKGLLEQYHEGLICCSACLGGEVPQKIMAGKTDEAEEAVKWFKNLFGEDYYLELQRHQTQKLRGNQLTYQKQMMVNPVLQELGKKYGIKVIATNDVHFVEEEHADAHELLVCLNTGKTLDEKIQKAEENDTEMAYSKQEWLKTPEEMAAIFSDIPEALENTEEIVRKVEIYSIDSDAIMPLFPIPESFGTEEEWRKKFTQEELYNEFTRNDKGEVVLTEEEATKKIKKLGGYDRLYRIKFEADYLRYLTMQGAEERYGKERVANDDVLNERINFELHTMKTMGFPGYFLIVMDFIRGAREELDVSVGPGRGSAAGSVVAYCLHITDLDPLEYDLLFERFLNPDRISLPDIDTDFEDSGRPKVLEWVSNKYGKTHVAHIITYGVMASKSAIADVGRVKSIPLARVNEIKGFIPDRGFPDSVKDEKGKTPKVNLKNCYKYVKELKELVEGGEPEIRSMLNYAEQLEDTIRQVGIHACGVIIGADDLTKFAPLSSIEDKETKKRVLVTEYDGHVVESVGLIKMDFLGLKTLSIIKECIRNIKKARGEDVDIDHISKEDPETYKLFQEGRTVAVFQFESPGMQKYMKELKPTVMGDLIAMNALYRPGPMQYIPQFIRRKHGLEAVTYDIPVMERYLKDTYGVTVYQEQVMLLSRLLADFTRGESDQLRKAMGKKQMDTLQKLKGKFMTGGKANGYDEQILDKIWKDWEAFASYAFNKSHAACYSWVAYQTAYLKAHYPAEFMAANLTISKDDIKEVTKFMDECKALKISVLEPDVNESELNFTVNSAGNIRFGLGGIKGVGEGAVEAIIEEREKNGKYKDIYDFIERVNLQACNKKTLESLAQSGAFDCFDGIYREQILGTNENGDQMSDVLIRYGNTFQQDRWQHQNSLFGDIGGIDIKKPDLPMVSKMSPIERLNIEKNMIGIFLSAHPLDEYAFEVKCMSNTTAEELHRFDGWRMPTSRREQPNNTEDGVDAEMEDDIKPNDWIRTHENQPMQLSGIITASELATSKNNNPYGRYTIEDYTGSFTFVLFGDTFQRFGHLLQENAYLRLTGVVQQRGAGGKWFKPKPLEEGEYEFRIQQVENLNEVQEKHLNAITLTIPIEHLTHELNMELVEQCQKHKGNAQLKIQMHDPIHQSRITFTSKNYTVKIGKEFYQWLDSKQQDNILSFSIN